MHSSRLPKIIRLNNNQPLLQRTDNPWENKVVLNPACIRVQERKICESVIRELDVGQTILDKLLSQDSLVFLLYRAQGEETPEYDYRKSSLGLAIFSPTLELLYRYPNPVIVPDTEYDALGVEDARISKFGDTFYLFYTAFAPDEDWGKVRIAIATSKDLIHWKKHSLLKGSFNTIDNKNAMLFEDRINGLYHMLHRPMDNRKEMHIHLATSNDILGEWVDKGPVMKSIPNTEFKQTWIGGGAPPLLLPDGKYLIIYHTGNYKFDMTREYTLGIAIADPAEENFIIKRDELLLKPETSAEKNGDTELGVNNVVFICGAYFYNNDLYLPYAGADSVILGAMIPAGELNRYLTS